MKEEIMQYPHPFITVSLLDGCNKACNHCYRTAIPSYQSFTLTKTDALRTLDDASSLNTACVFTGGECTIWKDADMDFLCLLKRAIKQNGRVAFLSNGFVFEDENYSNKFVRQYMQECGLPIQMWFTVDFLHGNYDAEGKRIPFLDNLLASRDAYASDESIDFFIISHWTNNQQFNIPIIVFEDYAKKGVRFKIDDFMTWGRAAELDDLSCHIQVGSSDKEHLGPFKQILTDFMIGNGYIQNENELNTFSNKALLSKFSVCGKAPNYLTSWDRKYYYCIPQMGYDWFAVSGLGHLDESVLERFYNNHPVLKEIQALSIFGLLEKYKEDISTTLLDNIESMKENIRFAGCSVCLYLFKKGIIQQINQKLLDNSNVII